MAMYFLDSSAIVKRNRGSLDDNKMKLCPVLPSAPQR